MSKERKKTVVTTTKATTDKKSRKINPTKSSRRTAASASAASRAIQREELIYKRENYLMMLAGVGLITLGMFLMSGGAMPSNDVWDPTIIYSARRTVLAPICILAGLVVEIVAIFKKF